jgi:hypothetical protein
VLDGFLLLERGSVALPSEARKADVSSHGLVDAALADLRHFPGLQTLDASDNALPMSCLSSLPGLTSLNLSCNSLAQVKLPPGTFEHLRELNLSHNALQPRSFQVLGQLPGLVSLDVSGNDLASIDVGEGTAAFPVLASLILANNKFAGVGPLQVLCELPRLRTLDVSRNFLDAVPPPPRELRLARALSGRKAALEGAPWFDSLEEINLAHNYLSNPANVSRLLGGARLRRIVLTGNPVAVEPSNIAVARRKRAKRRETGVVGRGGSDTLGALGAGGGDAALSHAIAASGGARAATLQNVTKRRRAAEVRQTAVGGGAGTFLTQSTGETFRVEADGNASAIATAAALLGGADMASAVANALLGKAMVPATAPGEAAVLDAAKAEILASLDAATLLRIRILREAAARGLVDGAGSNEWMQGSAPRELEIVTGGASEDPVAQRAGVSRVKALGREDKRPRGGGRLWTVKEDALPLGREWIAAGNKMLFEPNEDEEEDVPHWHDGDARLRVGDVPDWARSTLGRAIDNPSTVPTVKTQGGATISALARLGQARIANGGLFVAEPEVRPEGGVQAAPEGGGVLVSAGATLASLTLAGSSLPVDMTEQLRPETRGTIESVEWDATALRTQGLEEMRDEEEAPSKAMPVRLAVRELRRVLRRPHPAILSHALKGGGVPSYLRPTAASRSKFQDTVRRVQPPVPRPEAGDDRSLETPQQREPATMWRDDEYERYE